METDVLLTTVIAQIFCKLIVSLGLMHRASGFTPAESKMSSLAVDVHEAATPRSCCVCQQSYAWSNYLMNMHVFVPLKDFSEQR